jgi:ferritin-like metal-binding protein YciE
MKLTNFHDLFVLKVQKLYDGEQQIIEALPKMIEMCTTPELKTAFESHLEETREQARKLEDLCSKLNIEPEGMANMGMEGIIEAGTEVMMANDKSPLLDAAIIATAQDVEHAEIAGYGTAATYAELLGIHEAKEVLGDILQEEKATDETLTQIAEQIINKEAQQTTKRFAM